MTNCYKEIQAIYEDYRGDSLSWPIETSGMRALNTAPMSQTYPKGGLPGAQPGQGTSPLTVTVSDDEEEPIHYISKRDVLSIIDNLFKKADESGAVYAQEHLIDLLNDIAKLKTKTSSRPS